MPYFLWPQEALDHTIPFVDLLIKINLILYLQPPRGNSQNDKHNIQYEQRPNISYLLRKCTYRAQKNEQLQTAENVRFLESNPLLFS